MLKPDQFDVAILYQWFWTGTSLPEHYVHTIRRVSPHTRVAILSDDRHGLREMQMADLNKRFADVERAKDFEYRETETYRQADMVLGITEEDFAEFHRVTPNLLTEMLPMVAEKCPARARPSQATAPAVSRKLLELREPATDSDGISNASGLGSKRLPKVQMRLAGSSMPEILRALGDGVVGLGHVSDLAARLRRSRVRLAGPLRYRDQDKKPRGPVARDSGRHDHDGRRRNRSAKRQNRIDRGR